MARHVSNILKTVSQLSITLALLSSIPSVMASSSEGEDEWEMIPHEGSFSSSSALHHPDERAQEVALNIDEGGALVSPDNTSRRGPFNSPLGGQPQSIPEILPPLLSLEPGKSVKADQAKPKIKAPKQKKENTKKESAWPKGINPTPVGNLTKQPNNKK